MENAEVTLEFDAVTRRLAGRSGCNRYNAAFELSGEGLSIGPAASTRMACAPDLMAQEQQFLADLQRISRFDIDPSGALLLFANDQQDPLVVARISE